jgi:hypothetical protein
MGRQLASSVSCAISAWRLVAFTSSAPMRACSCAAARACSAIAELARSAAERCCRTGPSGVLTNPNSPRIENASNPSPRMPSTAMAAPAAMATPPTGRGDPTRDEGVDSLTAAAYQSIWNTRRGRSDNPSVATRRLRLPSPQASARLSQEAANNAVAMREVARAAADLDHFGAAVSLEVLALRRK